MRKLTQSELHSLSDKELIRLLLQNNASAIEYLMYDKCASMFNYILKEVFTYKVNKDELINEFYLFLSRENWKLVQQFEGRSKFTTWLSVVAVRFFVKNRKLLIVSQENSTPYTDSVTNIPCKSTHSNLVEKMDVINAIQKLTSSRDKFVLMCLEIEGFEVEEVAQQLNVTKANLYNIKKRAIERLSKILIEYNYVDR